MITTTLTVWCEGCSDWKYLEAIKKSIANAEIKRLGYKVINKKHYCQHCYEKLNPPKNSKPLQFP